VLPDVDIDIAVWDDELALADEVCPTSGRGTGVAPGGEVNEGIPPPLGVEPLVPGVLPLPAAGIRNLPSLPI